LKLIKCFCVLVLLAVLATPAIADMRIQAGPTPGTVTLYWDANSETDLAGYHVFWGRGSRVYTNAPQPTVAVMTAPTYTTPVLQNGTWYFAVTAFNKTGGESGYSNEVSTVINIAPAPPTGLRFTIAKVISAVWHWLTGRG
jgi:hypothetical protein